jgi:hypothetical protein
MEEWALVAHACIPSCSGGKDQEDRGSSQPEQIVRKTPISKITGAKCAGDVAQAVECLVCKCEP